MRLRLQRLTQGSALVLLGLAAMLVAACGGGATTKPGPQNLRNPQVFKMLWQGSNGNHISALDPGTGSDATVIPIENLVWDGLVTLDNNLNVELWGADKVTVSPDGLTYTFHVRAGQKFSDGQPVKPSDYAWSMDRVLNPCFNSPVNYYLWGIKGAAAFSGEGCVNGAPKGVQTLVGTSIVPDDGASTLTVTLDKPASYFLAAMTYPTSYALERSVVTGENLGADDTWTSALSHGPTGQGGSGMFYVSSYDNAGNLILKANPNWWGRSQGKKPYLTEVDLKIFADADSMYAAYDTGTTYDYDTNLPSSRLSEARQQPDYHESNLLAVQTVALNWKIAPFDNVDARLAFCEALNRDAIVNNVLKGGQTPSWHLVPKGMPGYNPSLTGPDNLTATSGDLAKAQQHWAAYKATLNGKPIPPIKYTYDTGSQTGKNYAEALVSAWNQAFPDANVRIEALTFEERIREQTAKLLQAYRFGWGADYPDPEDFLTLLYDTKSSYNNSNISDPAVDQLMEQADTLTDQTQRLKLYNQAEQQLVNEVGVCPVYQYKNFYRVRSYVHGYAENAQAFSANDNWVSMYISNS